MYNQSFIQYTNKTNPIDFSFNNLFLILIHKLFFLQIIEKTK